MKIREILRTLEEFAPLSFQDGYDNAGLQVGLADVETTGVLLCLDVTEKVIDEAVCKGANLIISHHPLLFKGLKRITGGSYIDRCVMKAIKHDITIYAMHTNLDNAYRGVSYIMASYMGLRNVTPLVPLKNQMLKLVVYVPHAHAGAVREALFAIGCGETVNYDSCSYCQKDGEGTFRPLMFAKPYVGRNGVLHSEPETRIEMLVPAHKCRLAEKVIAESHPYEEPAYDLIPLENSFACLGNGSGLIGDIEETPMEEFLLRLKRDFAVECLRHNRYSGRTVKRVALCGGAGSFLMPDAVAAGADAFVTGEIKYHEYFGYEDTMLLAELGHYQSEQYAVDIIRGVLCDKYGSECKCIESAEALKGNPIQYL